MTQLEHAALVYGSEEKFEIAVADTQEIADDLNAHLQSGGRVLLGADGFRPPVYLKAGLRFGSVKYYGGHPVALVVFDGERKLGTCKYPSKA